MSKSKFTSVLNNKTLFDVTFNDMLIPYTERLTIIKLGDLMSYIILILDSYQNGNFTDTIRLYPKYVLHTIAFNLVKLNINSKLLPQYAIAKQLAILCVQSLEQYMNQYILLLETQQKLINAEYYMNILFNRTKLQEYIDGLKKNMYLFPEINKNIAVPARILPQYEIYIETYGLPSSGIFDSEKLYNIIENLWQ